MNFKEFSNKYGVSKLLSKKALEYSKGDESLALAYAKAKTIAVATPKLTFDERVMLFLDKDSNIK